MRKFEADILNYRGGIMKIAVVTGGSGGIGSATVEKLLSEGYAVFSQYRSNKQNAVNGCVPIYGDFSTEEGVNRFADEIFSRTDHVDLLVNNAGCALQKIYTDCTDREVEEMIFCDLTAAMLLAKRFLPSMIKRKSGNIINVSSVWGVYGGSCEVAYSAAKGGLIAFTKALAKEVGLSGVRINCVAPGMIDTKMNGNISEEDKKIFAESTALGRMGKPYEIAETIAYLASDKAAFITGQTVSADGGY